MSSAQAAASAAFKAISTTKSPQKNEPASRRNYTLKLPESPQIVGASRASKSPISPATPRTKIPSPNNTARKRLTHRPTGSAKSTSSSSNGYDSKYSSSANLDYFSLPKYGTSESLSTPRSGNQSSTNPQDMLDQVRDSINSKCKSGAGKESRRRSKLALDEFRQSLDNRMNYSRAASDRETSSSQIGIVIDDTFHDLSSTASHSSIPSDIYKQVNKSQSSMGSSLSDSRNESTLHPPFLTVVDRASNESVVNAQPSAQTPSPIPVPLSSHAVDRHLAIASDTLMQRSLSSSSAAASGSEIPLDGEMVSPKPGRKPPQFVNEDSVRESLESENDDEQSEFSDLEENQSKVPTFPGFFNKPKSRKLLFHKKGRSHSHHSHPAPSSPNRDEEDLNWKPQTRNTAPVASQHVKLKTTMRQQSKRKEKKTAFNEDKPWKNHNDLETISDSQRKRYEGLWTSNKGLYMDLVITRIAGLDPESEKVESLPPSSREFTEKGMSEMAAKISTHFNLHSVQTDERELHGLDKVKKQDLMLGAVVKELWKRSKLSQETLQIIWDLVDCRKDGTLSKAEFIVGMWLVDQCLYGRKLPKSVSKSVWYSLGGLGINVVVKKKRR